MNERTEEECSNDSEESVVNEGYNGERGWKVKKVQ